MKVEFVHAIKEVEEVRALCIKYEWHTKGNSKEYSDMMTKYCRKKATPARVLAMAQDIADHSEFNDIETILYILYKDGVYHVAEMR